MQKLSQIRIPNPWWLRKNCVGVCGLFYFLTFCVCICLHSHTNPQTHFWSIASRERDRGYIEQTVASAKAKPVPAPASPLCVAPMGPEIRPQAQKLAWSCQGAQHGTREGCKMALCGMVSLCSTACDLEAPGANQKGAALCAGVYIWYQCGSQHCGKGGRFRRFNPSQSICCRLRGGQGDECH